MGGHQRFDLNAPRTLDYWVLRTCERLRFTETDFYALHYEDQLRLLSYTTLRAKEEVVPSA